MNDNLKIGDTGDNVKILQEKLKNLGFYNPLINGSFGLSTEIGVKKFQEEYQLNPTGIVDEKTWDILTQVTEPAIMPISIYPNLSFGSNGEYVKDLQIKLKNLLYYTGPINSNFDLETENAVKRLQLNNGITANGVVNSQTWDVINNLYGNLNECAIDNNYSNDNNYDNTYTVKSGDTLYGIAKKYNTTVDELKRINNLTSNILQIGQILKIPGSQTDNYFNYIVKKNDTLYSIARNYNTTVDEIKKINNLTSNIISIGQVLKIPNNNENQYINYTVVKGDTLYGIAKKYNTTVDEIKRINNLTSNILQIGQILKIPVN